ncbi:hypothetical protein [Geminocystis sp. GBBB08]|uniref:hypothetical protein n=1 Tax=Geminocystis sp. GBBB08 TaxID=2604140 RepID=UPI0027E34397|nr:hypothetical protein [Geminocystis sp. GBBB08]
MNAKVKSIVPFFILLIVGGGIWFLQEEYTKTYLEEKNNHIDYSLEEEKLRTALAIQKKMPTLGYGNLLADWQYLQFIQYFGDTQARDKTDYSAVTDYFELISKYDPYFVDAYFMLSTANSIYAAQPQKTVSLLNQVLSNLSPKINRDAFLLWMYKGVDEILFLGDIEEAKKSYNQSSKWALARGDEAGKLVAQRNLDTVKFLEENPDSKKAQVGAWGTVLSTVFDDKTRQMAIDKIKSLGGEVVISKNGEVQIKLPEDD